MKKCNTNICTVIVGDGMYYSEDKKKELLAINEDVLIIESEDVWYLMEFLKKYWPC